ncbi:hypothetical protein JXA32_05115, partial [Candidatus Sumerlaeota bacterium]|nr:hypothetical protein [Candidatus Sumerlaeota bacterium]
ERMMTPSGRWRREDWEEYGALKEHVRNQDLKLDQLLELHDAQRERLDRICAKIDDLNHLRRRGAMFGASAGTGAAAFLVALYEIVKQRLGL